MTLETTDDDLKRLRPNLQVQKINELDLIKFEKGAQKKIKPYLARGRTRSIEGKYKQGNEADDQYSNEDKSLEGPEALQAAGQIAIGNN